MALTVPHAPQDSPHHRRLLAHAINGALNGRTNNGGSVTLTQSSTTTVVTDFRAGTDSVIVLCPLTATAALAVSTTPGIYVSSRGKQTFTLTHNSTADADRTFDYALLAVGRGT